MKQNSLWRVAAGSLAVVLAVAGSASAQFGSHPEEQKIDVSSYPTEVRHGYKIFANRCSECHDLALSLKQTRSAHGWTAEVRKMRALPSSHLDPRETDAIVKFLAYDETHRKAAAREAASASSDGASDVAGKRIFDSYGCSSCHSVAGVGNTASSLDGVGGKKTAAELRRFIVSPPASCTMPPMSVSDKELDTLVAFLEALKSR